MWWRLTSRLASRAMSFALRTRLALPHGPMVRNSQGWIIFPTTHLFWVLLSSLHCHVSKWSSLVLHEAISFFRGKCIDVKNCTFILQELNLSRSLPFLLESWTIGAKIKLVYFCFKRIFILQSGLTEDEVAMTESGFLSWGWFSSQSCLLCLCRLASFLLSALSLLTLFLCLFTVTLPHWSMFTTLLRVISIMVRCKDILLWTLTVLSNHSSLSLMW